MNQLITGEKIHQFNMMIQPYCGCYLFKGNFYPDKETLLDAMMLNRNYDGFPKLYFNDHIFTKYDWTKEPSFTLEQLYIARAKQLRQEYDYLILSFSGGADSGEILHTFLNNNIFIDEIQTAHYDKLVHSVGENVILSDESTSLLLEYKLSAVPMLKKVQQISPNTKIKELDGSNFLYDQCTTNKFQFTNIDEKTVNGVNLLKPHRANTYYIHKHNHESFNYKGKGKVAFIRGYEKPQLFIENDRLYFRFNDVVLHSVKMMRSKHIDDLYTIENFFWSHKIPLIPIKQSHVIKRYIEKDPEFYNKIMEYNRKKSDFNENINTNLDKKMQNDFTNQPLERYYSNMIYKYVHLIPFIAPKPIKHSEHSLISKVEKAYTSHYDDIINERAQYYINKYNKIERKRILSRSISSRAYDIGPLERAL